jgi:hypothetical protein
MGRRVLGLVCRLLRWVSNELAMGIGMILDWSKLGERIGFSKWGYGYKFGEVDNGIN